MMAFHNSGTSVPATVRRRLRDLVGIHSGSRRSRAGLAGRRRRWRLLDKMRMPFIGAVLYWPHPARKAGDGSISCQTA